MAAAGCAGAVGWWPPRKGVEAEAEAAAAAETRKWAAAEWALVRFGNQQGDGLTVAAVAAAGAAGAAGSGAVAGSGRLRR